MATQKKSTPKKVSEPFVLAYYEHQYDRMGKLEQYRLTMTNIVVTVSVVAFTFGFDSSKNLTLTTGLVLPFVVVVANIFAAIYVERTRSWIGTAERRAKRTLELYADSLYDLDKTTFEPYHPKAISLWKIQLFLHVLLVVAAIVPAVQYVLTLL